MHQKYIKPLNNPRRGESEIKNLRSRSQLYDSVSSNHSRHKPNSERDIHHEKFSEVLNLIKHHYAMNSERALDPLFNSPSNKDVATMNDLYADDESFFRSFFSPTGAPPEDSISFTQVNANISKDEVEDTGIHGLFKLGRNSYNGFFLYTAVHMLFRVIDTLVAIYKNVDKERLPWRSDFMNLDQMSFPANSKEALSRINLNVPYYAWNYMELSCIITLPFLLFYSLPYFVVYFVTCMLIYGVLVKGIETSQSHSFICLWGFQIAYHILGHSLLFAYCVVFLFFDGVKTGLMIFLMNFLIVIPHALWRTPPYFDDEKLEKCRPLLVRYALMLIMLFLVYLEGDLLDPEEEMRSNENLRNAQQERERLGISFEDAPKS